MKEKGQLDLTFIYNEDKIVYHLHLFHVLQLPLLVKLAHLYAHQNHPDITLMESRKNCASLISFFLLRDQLLHHKNPFQ